MTRRFKYMNGTERQYPIAVGENPGPLWPIRFIRMDLVEIEGRNYDWAIKNIKQTMRMSGNKLPAVWFPGTFGVNCDVLFYDDERIILQSGMVVYELVKVARK